MRVLQDDAAIFALGLMAGVAMTCPQPAEMFSDRLQLTVLAALRQG